MSNEIKPLQGMSDISGFELECWQEIEEDCPRSLFKLWLQ